MAFQYSNAMWKYMECNAELIETLSKKTSVVIWQKDSIFYLQYLLEPVIKKYFKTYFFWQKLKRLMLAKN
jgi:hypothetical protein